MKYKFLLTLFLALSILTHISAQVKKTDVNTPLYLLPPDYPIPYGPAKADEVKAILDRVRNYLESTTPMKVIDSQSKETITDFSKPNYNAILEPGAYRLISYEWGVVYSGMLSVGDATGDARFSDYATNRINFIAGLTPYFKELYKANPQNTNPLRAVIEPHALDDAGSMCAAMIKVARRGDKADLRPLIDNYIQYISTKEYRLADGTLARNRPQRNTLWLDDLYMSVPALSQMGKLTGEKKYYDDAVKQVVQFSKRMFNKDKGLFMHGWVQEMNVHPEFYWGRANGWGMLTLTELLDVLPENHPGRPVILNLLREHIRGIANCQSGTGFWHQLLDRNDSYNETSATAIFTYCIAHAINKGWIDPIAYGPMVMLSWNALSTKVNAQGEVEGTCVGTGMGFDPAFYYYRPTNPLAAHGYGPVLLAGAEVLNLLKNYQVVINETSVMFYHKNVDWKNLQIK
ncbi:MAG: glycoside hydrolase family 88 protein [Bacteroidota bacterium]|nr:glycoside hydrolase family 88 protein [Bacteroidota bacterium]